MRKTVKDFVSLDQKKNDDKDNKKENINNSKDDVPRETQTNLWPKYPHTLAIISNHNITIEDDFWPERCSLWRSKGLDTFVWTS